VTYQRDALPGFAGIPTFFRAPRADFGQLGGGVVAVMGAPHDSTLGSRQGTRYGPRGIRAGSLETIAYIQAGPEKFVTHIASGTRMSLAPGAPLVDVGDLPVYPNDLDRTRESLRRGASLAATSGALPVMFGGDHYVTFPLFQGVSEGLAARGAKRLGYIQLDNHLDLSDDNRIWGKHYHGSQARRISELPIVDARNMVWVGASGYTPREQVDWLRSSGATLWTPADIHRQGIAQIVNRAIELASHGTDGVYVSLDIDVVNGGASPGTGSVVTDGLSPQELIQAMGMLAASGVVRALDVTEVAPPLDPSERTVRIAASAVLEFLTPKIYVREPHVVERVHRWEANRVPA
jgi:arginase family enzyme